MSYLPRRAPVGAEMRPRGALWRFWLLPAFLAVLGLLFSGTAAASGKRVALYIEGSIGDDLSEEIVDALPSGLSVIDSSELSDALAAQKVKRVAAAFANAKKHSALPRKLQRAASSVGADAVVLGAVDEDSHELHLMVLISGQSEPVVDEAMPVGDNKKKRRARFRALLKAPLSKLGSAAGAAEKPAANADDPEVPEKPVEPAREADETASAPRTFANALLTGFAGLDFGGRQLHYRDRISNAVLRPYDLPSGALLPVAPGLAASVEVFPFASTTWAVARDLGLNARLSYNFASSKVADVAPKTSWFGYEINLRGRLLLGPRRTAPLIGLEGGVGRQAFTFKAPGLVQDILPSVDYYYLRFGADGRIPVGTAAVIVGAGYRHLQTRRAPSGATVEAAGLFGEHFPHAKISGLDLKLGGALPLASYIEARLVLNYARYWSVLNPQPGDAYVAGGALDQILNADLGVAAFF